MDRVKQTTRQTAARVKEITRPVGHGRLARLFAVSLILWSALLPLAGWLHDRASYQLSAATKQVIGPANPNLSAKFSYDSQNDVWQFNKEGSAVRAAAIAKEQGNLDVSGVATALSQLQAKVGGGGKKDTSLYSVDLPTKADRGMTFYENQTNQSFKLVPQFKVKDGKEWQGRVVYPFGDGGQIVYTAKTNGIKEDIVLSKDIGDALQFSYKLQLPKTLEAKLGEDGSVGIYSADPALYSNITYSKDADRAKIESAREQAAKDHMVFGLPAPIVKDNHGKEREGVFALQGDTLTVTVNGLHDLHYPLSVDPSVVVTSTSDFSMGNDEGMIDWGTANQVGRTGITGGAISAGFTDTTALTNSHYTGGGAIYNGYMYIVGGQGSGSTGANALEYAQITGGGTVGSWTNVSSLLPDGLYYQNVFAYNGYLYIMGGYSNTGATVQSAVYYMKLNSNGSVGTVQTSSNSMATAVCRAGGAVYNGYVYIVGGESAPPAGCGNTATSLLDTTQYAPILANGDVGAWTTSSNHLSDAVMSPAVTSYNGFLYSFGGGTSGSTGPKTTQYAQFQSNGDIGAWTVATGGDFASGTEYRHSVIAYDGYLYWFRDAGSSPGSTYYAQINADGSVGDFQQTAAWYSVGGAWGASVMAYKGYLYWATNNDTGTTQKEVAAAPIDSPGPVGQFSSTNHNFTTTRRGAQSVTYDGYLYVLGGENGGAPIATVNKGTITTDSNGITTTSAIGGTTAFTTAGGRAYFGAVAYNGYMYILGGCTASATSYSQCSNTANETNTVWMSPISETDGTLGTWVAQTAFTTARYGLAAVAYNGYMYVMGGLNGSTFKNDIQYHAMNATTGAISGAWTTSAKTLNSSEAYMQAAVYAGTLYIVGGCTAGALTCTTTLNTTYSAALASSGDLNATLAAGTTFTTGRGNFGLTIANNTMYITGGRTNTTFYSDVQYAPISGSTLGSWTTMANSTLPQTRWGIGMGSSGGNLFVLGGYDGTTYYSDVYTAQVQNGGAGTVGTWTTSANTIANIAVGNGQVAYNGYLYSLGGVNGTTFYPDVQYAAIAADGSIGTWSTATSLPLNLANFGSFAYNGYMYILGGNSSAATRYNGVLFAPINSNGSLGAWHYTHNSTDDGASLVGGFATARSELASVTYNGYAYVIGGFDGTVVDSDVQYAPINNDGTIGTWASTTSLTNGRRSLNALVYNGYLYVAGGYQGSTSQRDIQVGTFSSGAVTWQTTTNIMSGHDTFQMYAYNGFMYIIGGNDESAAVNIDVQYAPILSGGGLGSWNGQAMSGSPRKSTTTVVYNGHIYIVGGQSTAGVRQNNVQYAPLVTIARTGHYSVLVDLGTTGAVSAVNYNGSMSTASSVQYRVAPSTGALGSLISGASGSGSDPGTSCAALSDSYVWILVTFDDNATAVYGGTSTRSNVTDLTAYYTVGSRPAPAQRLYGGKYFKSQVQQPLDTCGP